MSVEMLRNDDVPVGFASRLEHDERSRPVAERTHNLRRRFKQLRTRRAGTFDKIGGRILERPKPLAVSF